MSEAEDDVLFDRPGTLGRITLNRPRALNALTLGMIRAITAMLSAWARDGSVAAVLIMGAGDRGLCAGGDIRALYEAACREDGSVAERFFREEYKLNARIARFPKPYIALMDGLVMGGGIGVSAHGSYRVVTERSRLAMPECGIGFVPDVGGTWLLSRAPGEAGTHAALTSAQLGPADAIACGLADLCVPSADLPVLVQSLALCREPGEVLACLETHRAEPPPGQLAADRDWIDRCYGSDSVEAVLAALQGSDQPRARQAATELATKSPTSLKVTLRALREARALPSLEHALEQEYRLALALTASPDFREGVRAAVIDKDRRPLWIPSRLADVSDATVDRIFAADDHGGLELV